jgi:hypothetical protein
MKIRTKKRYKKPKMKDYDEKFYYLIRKQGGKCAITGKKFTCRWLIQMHHIIAKDKPSCRLYPDYIDCVWNLALVDGGSHDNDPLPKKPGWPEVALLNEIVRDYPGIEYEMTAEEALREYGGTK